MNGTINANSRQTSNAVLSVLRNRRSSSRPRVHAIIDGCERSASISRSTIHSLRRRSSSSCASKASSSSISVSTVLLVHLLDELAPAPFDLADALVEFLDAGARAAPCAHRAHRQVCCRPRKARRRQWHQARRAHHMPPEAPGAAPWRPTATRAPHRRRRCCAQARRASRAPLRAAPAAAAESGCPASRRLASRRLAPRRLPPGFPDLLAHCSRVIPQSVLN